MILDGNSTLSSERTKNPDTDTIWLQKITFSPSSKKSLNKRQELLQYFHRNISKCVIIHFYVLINTGMYKNKRVTRTKSTSETEDAVTDHLINAFYYEYEQLLKIPALLMLF